jgi:hypothetical protein
MVIIKELGGRVVKSKFCLFHARSLFDPTGDDRRLLARGTVITRGRELLRVGSRN